MTEPNDNFLGQIRGNQALDAVGADGRMRPEDAKVLERYRTLFRNAQARKARVQEIKARIREQGNRISGLDSSARDARIRFDETLSQLMASGMTESLDAGNKEEVAKLEGDLAEARGILRGLEAELPRLEATIPNDAEIDRAKRDAWNVVARDLETKIPRELTDFVAKFYAAMLNHYPEAAFSAALVALCPAPPARQACAELTKALSEEYNIPSK